jgi:hypothetical protein
MRLIISNSQPLAHVRHTVRIAVHPAVGDGSYPGVADGTREAEAMIGHTVVRSVRKRFPSVDHTHVGNSKPKAA